MLTGRHLPASSLLTCQTDLDIIFSLFPFSKSKITFLSFPLDIDLREENQGASASNTNGLAVKIVYGENLHNREWICFLRNLLYKKMLIIKTLNPFPKQLCWRWYLANFQKREINTLFIAAWSIVSLEQLTWSNRGDGAGVCVCVCV